MNESSHGPPEEVVQELHPRLLKDIDEAESEALKVSISLLPWAVELMDLRWN